MLLCDVIYFANNVFFDVQVSLLLSKTCYKLFSKVTSMVVNQQGGRAMPYDVP